METNVFSAFNQSINSQKETYTGYEFEGIPDLFSDNFGNFWYKGNPIKKLHRPYQVYLLIDGKQIGIPTLRKLARKTTKDLCPF